MYIIYTIVRTEDFLALEFLRKIELGFKIYANSVVY